MKTTSRKLLYLVAVDQYFCSHRLPLAEEAIKQGYEVHLATVVTSYREKIENAGIHIWPLLHLKRGHASIFEDLKGVYEISKLMATIHPDIIHAVAMKPVLFGSIAAQFRKIPRQIYALGGLGYLFTSKTFKAKLIRPIVKMFWKLFLRGKGKTLILQNMDDYNLFIDQNILRKDNLTLIAGSGVDLDQFKPKEHDNKVPIITLMARLLWDKGVGETVQACQILHDKGLSFKLLLCGNPDMENPTAIPIDTLNHWNALSFVEWKGHVDNVSKIYQDSDIAVLPSYREGLPKSLIEAAASGLPIVTTDTSGCRDVIVPGETGFLVPVKSIGLLADALAKYINDPVLRKKHGKAGRRFCEKNFSIDYVKKATFNLYKY